MFFTLFVRPQEADTLLTGLCSQVPSEGEGNGLPSLVPGPFWRRGTLISGPRSFWGEDTPVKTRTEVPPPSHVQDDEGPLLQTRDVMDRFRRGRYASCGDAGGLSF